MTSLAISVVLRLALSFYPDGEVISDNQDPNRKGREELRKDRKERANPGGQECTPYTDLVGRRDAGRHDFEALYEVYGMEGTTVASKLLTTVPLNTAAMWKN